MKTNQFESLRNIMMLQFIAVELNLFLDTHPGDERALEDFRCISQELLEAKSEYEAQYEPLLNFGLGYPSDPNCFTWVNDPWPWEINWKRGV